MKETIAKINEDISALQADIAKTAEGNKAAAARARKATLELEKLGKQYRKESVNTLFGICSKEVQWASLML